MPLSAPDVFAAAGGSVGPNGGIEGYKAEVEEKTGTTYTLQAADTGKVLEFNNAAAITVTLPNSLPKGWCATLTQTGAGLVTLAAAAGATMREPDGYCDFYGQWASVMLYVRSNSDGASAEYVLAGRLAA